MESQMLNKRVLIVDDEENIALVVATGLVKMSKYTVDTAYNGQTALARFKQNPYHLVITDYRMPDMTGVELARAIRQIAPETQIVLMTAYGSAMIRAEADQVRMDGYIEKPVPIATVRNLVEEILDKTGPKTAAAPQPNKMADAVYDRVRKLRFDTNARCVLLLRSEGHLVVIEGHTENLDATSIGALVAANFMAATELARLLGNQSVFKSSYHEGPHYDIFAVDINGQYLLAVIFGTETKAGLVRYYTQDAAAQLTSLLDNLTPEVPTVPEDMPEVIAAELDELFGLGSNETSPVMSLEQAVAAGLVPAEVAELVSK